MTNNAPQRRKPGRREKKKPSFRPRPEPRLALRSLRGGEGVLIMAGGPRGGATGRT